MLFCAHECCRVHTQVRHGTTTDRTRFRVTDSLLSVSQSRVLRTLLTNRLPRACGNRSTDGSIRRCELGSILLTCGCKCVDVAAFLHSSAAGRTTNRRPGSGHAPFSMTSQGEPFSQSSIYSHSPRLRWTSAPLARVPEHRAVCLAAGIIALRRLTPDLGVYAIALLHVCDLLATAPGSRVPV